MQPLNRLRALQMMYIVAAVDVDVREAKRVAKANATAAEGAGNGVAQRGAEGPGSRWRRGDEGRIHVHEQVVCSIKAHQNGTLEIAPGAHCTARQIVAPIVSPSFWLCLEPKITEEPYQLYHRYVVSPPLVQEEYSGRVYENHGSARVFCNDVWDHHTWRVEKWTTICYRCDNRIGNGSRLPCITVIEGAGRIHHHEPGDKPRNITVFLCAGNNSQQLLCRNETYSLESMQGTTTFSQHLSETWSCNECLGAISWRLRIY